MTGNTKQSLIAILFHKMLQSKNWCFTLNNYTEGDINSLDKLECKYIIYGKEVGKCGTPHLQGFVAFEKRKTFSKVKLSFDKYHLEKCKGSAKQNIIYCKKDGVFLERGDVPHQGSRSDLLAMVTDKCNVSNTNTDMVSKYGDSYITHYKTVTNMATLLRRDKTLVIMKNMFTIESLRPWQSQILKTLNEQNDRQVLWIYDEPGNTGKTYLAKCIVSQYDGIYFTNSKSSDIFYAYKSQTHVVFDFSRCKDGFIVYSTIESLKNGIYFSSKYESSQNIFEPPKIIILSNFLPDRKMLSADRWQVYEVKKENVFNSFIVCKI